MSKMIKVNNIICTKYNIINIISCDTNVMTAIYTSIYADKNSSVIYITIYIININKNIIICKYYYIA